MIVNCLMIFIYWWIVCNSTSAIILTLLFTICCQYLLSFFESKYLQRSLHQNPQHRTYHIELLSPDIEANNLRIGCSILEKMEKMQFTWKHLCQFLMPGKNVKTPIILKNIFGIPREIRSVPMGDLGQWVAPWHELQALLCQKCLKLHNFGKKEV